MQKKDREEIRSAGCWKTGSVFVGQLARLFSSCGTNTGEENVCVASAGICHEVLERQWGPFREAHHGVPHLWEDLPAQHF